MATIIKTCTKCNVDKPITEFYKYKDRGVIRMRGDCKICSKNYTKKYRQSHPKYMKSYMQKWTKEYSNKNREKTNEYKRKYYENNKEIIHAKANNKRKNNINIRVAGNLRHRIWLALHSNIKSTSTIELLGCSIDELKQHLESLWQPVMSWDNYGRNGWHIDHIIPCSAFELQYSEEQEVCFHWTNLQPLWEADNIRKGGSTYGYY